jgi:hypothetical protein
MFKLNRTAGILWTIYLQDIIHSFQYCKESLLLFCVISAIYILGNNRKWLIIVIPTILSGFISYSGVVSANLSLSKGMMLNFWHLWQPSFNISIGYGKIFVYIQALPYILAMLYFIRHARLISIEFFIFAFLSIVYSFIYSEPRYRELFMPFLFLYVSVPLSSHVKGLNVEDKFAGLIILIKRQFKTGEKFVLPKLENLKWVPRITL